MLLLADISDTSPAAPGTVVSKIVSPNSSDTPAVLANLSEYESLVITAKVQGATGGTLDIYLQSWDGTDWIDWLHFTQLAGAAAAASLVYVPQQPATSTIVIVGRNASPLLASGTGVGGHPGESLRMLFVSGTGTTAGALQTVRILARNRWTR
jgi:hypothetical protein